MGSSCPNSPFLPFLKHFFTRLLQIPIPHFFQKEKVICYESILQVKTITRCHCTEIIPLYETYSALQYTLDLTTSLIIRRICWHSCSDAYISRPVTGTPLWLDISKNAHFSCKMLNVHKRKPCWPFTNMERLMSKFVQEWLEIKLDLNILLPNLCSIRSFPTFSLFFSFFDTRWNVPTKSFLSKYLPSGRPHFANIHFNSWQDWNSTLVNWVVCAGILLPSFLSVFGGVSLNDEFIHFLM